MRLSASVSAVGQRRRAALPVLAMIIVLAVALAFLSPRILLPNNLLNILNQQASLVAVTIGQAFVILTGGLDLSVGSVVSLTTAILSHNAAWSLPAAVAAALSVGLVNALGITRFGIHPILMTLSTMTAVQGLALLVRPVPGGEVAGWLTAYGAGKLFGVVPLPIFAALILVVGVSYVLGRTRFGLHIYATGSSQESARLGGVNATRIVVSVYLLSSLFACLGGINVAGRLASGDPLVGLPFSVDSIAATALGGTMLSGGMGGILGPVGGVLFLALLGNGLNFLNVSTYYQMIIKGVLLILAVSAHRRSTPGL